MSIYSRTITNVSDTKLISAPDHMHMITQLYILHTDRQTNTHTARSRSTATNATYYSQQLMIFASKT